MTSVQVGACVSGVGYLCAIYGGWKLYRNTPPDRIFGTIPVTDDIETFQTEERRQIDSRARMNARGFLLLVIGSALQLTGTLLAAFWS